MPGNGHPTSLSGMFVLPMAAFLSNHDPTVVFDYTQNFSNSHYSACLRLFGGILVEIGQMNSNLSQPKRRDRLPVELCRFAVSE